MIRTFQLPPPGVPSRLKRRERTPAAEGGNMGEKMPRILPKVATYTSLLGSFACRKWHVNGALRNFFRPKNPTASAGFEPAISGNKGQHAHL